MIDTRVVPARTSPPGKSRTTSQLRPAHSRLRNGPASVITLIRKYPGAHVVPAGPMGGSAACFERTTGTADSVAMCAWSDNDTFGILVSPTLNAASLADLMVQDRPLIELVKK